MANEGANDVNEPVLFRAEDQCPVIDLGFPANQRDINFIVLNDIHLSDRPHLKGIEGSEGTWIRSVDGRDVETTLSNLANYLNGPYTPLKNKIPTVIIINGDAGSKGTREEELNRLEDIVQIIGREFEGIPVVYSLGNHDMNRTLPHECEAITGYPARPFGLVAGSWHIPIINPAYTTVPDMGQNNHYMVRSHFDQLKEWTRNAARSTGDMFAVCHTNLKNRAVDQQGTDSEGKLPPYAEVSGWNAYEEADVTTALIKTRTAFYELTEVTNGALNRIICAHKHEDANTLLKSCGNGTPVRTIAAAFSAVTLPRLPEYFNDPSAMPMQETAGNFTWIKARKDGLHVHHLSLAGLSVAPQNIAPEYAELDSDLDIPRLAAE